MENYSQVFQYAGRNAGDAIDTYLYMAGAMDNGIGSCKVARCDGAT